MSKEYTAEKRYSCSRCGEVALTGDPLYFDTAGQKLCETCHEELQRGPAQYNQDGFGEPEK